MVRTGRWGCWCRRSAGWRFGPFVGQAIPLMVEAWRRAPEEDDDLRELSLAALEGFVLRCPQASRCIPLLWVIPLGKPCQPFPDSSHKTFLSSLFCLSCDTSGGP